MGKPDEDREKQLQEVQDGVLYDDGWSGAIGWSESISRRCKREPDEPEEPADPPVEADFVVEAE